MQRINNNGLKTLVIRILAGVVLVIIGAMLTRGWAVQDKNEGRIGVLEQGYAEKKIILVEIKEDIERIETNANAHIEDNKNEFKALHGRLSRIDSITLSLSMKVDWIIEEIQ